MSAQYVIYVRKYDATGWLPIACPDRDSADGMIRHVLGGSGEYDVVRVVRRQGGSESSVYVDSGERHVRKIIPDPPIGG